MFIYKISNSINDKVYIGQTVEPASRWSRHKSNVKNGTKTILAQAMRKYGVDNFKFEIIDGANSLSELSYKEVHLIYHYNSLAPFGYNLKIKYQQHPINKKIAPDIIKSSPKFGNVIEGLNRGRIQNNKNRQIYIKAINIITNEIRIYENIRKCDLLGDHWLTVYNMLRGKTPYKPAFGWYFEFLNKPTIKKESKKPNRKIGERKKLLNNCTTT